MLETDNCSGCPQHHDCKSMYQALGKAEGCHVAIRAVAAFLLPIVIFAFGLAIFDKLLVSGIESDNLRTLTSVICSLVLCSVYVLAFRIFSVKGGGPKKTCRL